MNPYSKIYAQNGVCVARSFRALKRLLHYSKLRSQKFYLLMSDGEKRQFEVITIPGGNFTGFGKGDKLHGQNRKHKSKYNVGAKVKYRVSWLKS